MKDKPGFPSRADFVYWTLRQRTPNWAQKFKLPIASDIDSVVNSHAPTDNRDPHYLVSNTLNTLKMIRKGEGRYYKSGEMIRRILEFSNRMGGKDREGFYGIFARRLLRKMKRN